MRYGSLVSKGRETLKVLGVMVGKAEKIMGINKTERLEILGE